MEEEVVTVEAEVEEKNTEEEKEPEVKGLRARIRKRFRRSRKSVHEWFRRKQRLWAVLEWIHQNFCNFCTPVDFDDIIVNCEGVRWQLYDAEHLITKPPDWYVPWDLESRQMKKFSVADLFDDDDDDDEYWGWTARPIVPKIDPETGSFLFKFRDCKPEDIF